MRNQISALYERIRNGNIDSKEALEQLKLLGAQGTWKTAFSSGPVKEQSTITETAATEEAGVLKNKILTVLLDTASKILNVNADEMDENVELEEYGFDMVKLSEFADEINKDYMLELGYTVFSRNTTLKSLAQFLSVEYGDTFIKLLGYEKQEFLPVIKEVNDKVAIQKSIHLEDASNYLKNLLSTVIKLPAERIEIDAPMEKYGIDSVMVMELTIELEKKFGLLPKTLFYEYGNIRELSTYFLESYPEKMVELLGIGKTENEISDSGRVALVEKAKFAAVRQRRPGFSFTRSGQETEGKKDAAEIAIIGVSGRYAGARNLKEFWSNLKNGKDSITEIPEDRWDHSLYFDEDRNKPGKTYSKWGGFIDDVDKFDPLFFNISPRDAELMDPQERLFLECVYEAVEDAGYTRQTLATLKERGLEGNVGVFAGVMYEEYQLYGVQETMQGRPIALPGNPSSIANRVSYFFNFHGPSIAVDTMCSSSITAIHLACGSLQRGECQLAVAGGVNVSIHPNKYLGLGQGRFVSSKGRCESFGEGGDGYVPGEGVGAVILKPLSKALEDKDQIYGVIKASALNHGGKTNGFTVPNPNAQAGVIGDVFKSAGIDPRTISYIEAHGTGTSLGDPIEIAGLTKAFREYTKDRQFCAIGSAKSNIGHCESAAGIAAVTKVLLQLKYRQLVPSLHSKVLNPNIDFENTPFVVQQELTSWNKPVINGREIPRRAGISSFGAGGSNAHIVIEEYMPENSKNLPSMEIPHNRVIVVLSAKNEKRLEKLAKRLLDVIEDGQLTQRDIFNMAYTLQIGREAMEERLAFTAGTLKEAEEKLKGLLEEKDGMDGLYRGNIRDSKGNKTGLETEIEIREAIENHIKNKDYEKLCRLWVKGTAVNWEKLYEGGGKPSRISLPTYPFARNSYWAPSKAKGQGYYDAYKARRLHPLIDRNTSNFKEQKFSVRLTGQEFYLRDHKVGGTKTLPGTAYIEMARAAGEMAAEQKVRKLKNIFWIRPVTIEEAHKDIDIRLYPGDDVVDFMVSSIDREGANVVHGQGQIVFEGAGKAKDYEFGIDIEEIKNSAASILSGEECYLGFESKGLGYGTGFRTIQKIFVGEKGVLAHLQLPPSLKESFGDFGLHPGLLDGAFQSLIGLVGKDSGVDAGSDPMLPFALEEIELINPLTETCYAIISAVGDMQNGPVKKFKIMIQDENGLPLLAINNFTVREFRRDKTKNKEAVKKNPLLYLRPVWKGSPLSGKDEAIIEKNVLILDTGEDFYNSYIECLDKNDVSSRGVTLAVLGRSYRETGDCSYTINLDNEEDFTKLVKSLAQRDRIPELIIHLWSKVGFAADEKDIKSGLAGGVYSLLYLSKAFINCKINRKIQLFHIHKGADEPQPYYTAIGAFAKTLRQENSRFLFKSIEIQKDNINQQVQPEEILAAVAGELTADAVREETEVRYQGRERFVKVLTETDPLVEGLNGEKNTFLKKDGIYLITGGAGGLGLIFADYMVRQEKVTLILSGRSQLSSEKQKVLDNLNKWGSKIIYLPFDVSRKEDVDQLALKLSSEYGCLSGIIHSAGLTRDTLIPGKTKQAFDEVLAPKVFGTVWLDEAFKDHLLDFFVSFSSVSGVWGNAGQSDYSFGNSFMDVFIQRREDLRKRGKRQGKSLSINWPLWQDGGMKVDEKTSQRMESASGIIPLSVSRGIEGFINAVKSDFSQIVILDGDRNKIVEKLGIEGSAPDTALKKETFRLISQNSGANDAGIRSRVEEDLVMLVVELLKVNKSDLDKEADLGDYGIDSIIMMTMLSRIEEIYGITLEPSAIYENSSITRLAEYILPMLDLSSKDLHLGADMEEAAVEYTDEEEQTEWAGYEKYEVPSITPGRLNRLKVRSESDTGKIAVIGMACRFPKSHSLEEYWSNLKNGRCMITEIPEDRWRISDFYSSRKDEKGKGYSKWGGFINDIYLFDADYFGIKYEDAVMMDPQHRILLELSEELITRSGYRRDEIGNTRTGVFIGGGESSYIKNNKDRITENGMKHLIVNMIQNMMAARISDFYNLKGPSLTVDTACSSSLVAIHKACQSITSGECEMAIAGGIELLLDPTLHVGFSKAEVLSPDGICYVFDERANGFVLGEGAGIVLLKPYEKAVQDGDHISAVILGSAVNNDGHTMGLTVPSQDGQKEVISQALKNSGVAPDSISYLEAHGTGTLLGDPIEIRAASQVYQNATRETQYCAVGSVKTNMGHLIRAAGAASFIKVALALENKIIPPTLNCLRPHPRFKFESSPFYPVREVREWCPRNNFRRAAISSFGFGGTNCHMILEEFQGNKVENYMPVRTGLPLNTFRRKYFCIGKEITDEIRESGLQEDYILRLLEGLKSGEVSLEDALASIGK